MDLLSYKALQNRLLDLRTDAKRLNPGNWTSPSLFIDVPEADGLLEEMETAWPLLSEEERGILSQPDPSATWPFDDLQVTDSANDFTADAEQDIAKRMRRLRVDFQTAQEGLIAREAESLRRHNNEIKEIDASLLKLECQFRKEWEKEKSALDSLISTVHRPIARSSKDRKGAEDSLEDELPCAPFHMKEFWAKRMTALDRLVCVLEMDRDRVWRAAELVTLFSTWGNIKPSTTRTYLCKLQREKRIGDCGFGKHTALRTDAESSKIDPRTDSRDG